MRQWGEQNEAASSPPGPPRASRARRRTHAPVVGLGCVVDVETVPCEGLIAQASRSARNGYGRPAVHRLVCASALRFEQDAGGAFLRLRLSTFTTERHPEHEIVSGIDACLADPADDRAMLISWNGRHDLRMLRHRAVALWMTDLPNLRGWTEGATAGRHVDGMADGGLGHRDWWRLSDVCGGLGFGLHADGATVAGLHATGEWSRIVERNRLDVLGTFLVHAAREAFRRGCPLPLATAWAGVPALLGPPASRTRHENDLANHYLVAVARERLASHGRGAGCTGCRNAAGRAR